MVVQTPVIGVKPENRRRVFGQINITVKLNGLYRQLVWLWDRIWCLRTCVGTLYIKDAIAIDTQMNIVRSAELDARTTTIENKGDAVVKIYESQQLVALLQPGEVTSLPMPGRGRIWARSLSGSQSITITTMRNCACGVAAENDEYDHPVGAFLL